MLGCNYPQSPLDAAVIDLGPAMFEDSMAYVALSRVRTLEGVALLDLVSDKIKVQLGKAQSKVIRIQYNHCAHFTIVCLSHSTLPTTTFPPYQRSQYF